MRRAGTLAAACVLGVFLALPFRMPVPAAVPGSNAVPDMAVIPGSNAVPDMAVIPGRTAVLDRAAVPGGAAAPDSTALEFTADDFDAEKIQAFLDGLSVKGGWSLSFRETMERIMAGDLETVLEEAASSAGSALFGEIRTNMALVGQVITLAVIGAVFSNFSDAFGPRHVSETGFYMIYLSAMTFLASGFLASLNIADQVSGELSEFMKVLLPAYFLAVAMAGGAVTSSAVCGFTFAAIGGVQAVLSEFLLPFLRVYMMAALVGNLYKEDMISRLTGLMRQAILWTMRTMFGIIVGFHLIQGLVLPQADALKNASLMRLAQAIPGIGAGAGAVSQIVMGSGILIKNAAGAAAVVILFLLAAVPAGKLAILTALYYIAAAVMQPVCDRRLAACVSAAAEGHAMLLKLVGYSLALFAATVAVLCISTNAAWYAG